MWTHPPNTADKLELSFSFLLFFHIFEMYDSTMEIKHVYYRKTDIRLKLNLARLLLNLFNSLWKNDKMLSKAHIIFSLTIQSAKSFCINHPGCPPSRSRNTLCWQLHIRKNTYVDHTVWRYHVGFAFIQWHQTQGSMPGGGAIGQNLVQLKRFGTVNI